MSNLTMMIDDRILKKARRIALEKDTTLTGLVRRFLHSLVMREEIRKEDALSRLGEIWESSRAVVGPVRWNRGDLHER
jgi:hypothetical protein